MIGGTDTAAATVTVDEAIATGSGGLFSAVTGSAVLTSLSAVIDIVEGGLESVGRVRRKRDPARGAAQLRRAVSFESGEWSRGFGLVATFELSIAWLSTCPD